MKCPKCFVDVEFIFGYSTVLFEGILNEDGELMGFENPIIRHPETLVCPECDNEIEVKLAKEFEFKW